MDDVADALSEDCCNDDVTVATTGQHCKVQLACALAVVLPVSLASLPAPLPGTALRMTTLAPDWLSWAPAGVWRPP